MTRDLLPRLASVLFGNVVSKGDSGSVYLTFDDGPDPKTTPEVLEILHDHDCLAHFFMSGRQVSAHPETARSVAEAGHVIGCHGFAHDSLMFASRRQVLMDTGRALDATEDAMIVASRLYRPPYGRIGAGMLKAAKDLGLMTVLWSLNSEDYKPFSGNELVEQLIKKVKPGDIILLHDRGNYIAEMLKALPHLISGIRDKELKVGKLDE